VRRIDGATPSASAATTRHDAMDREGVVASPPRRGPPRRARENDIESRRVVTHSNCLFKAPQSARRVESPPRGTIARAVVSNARGSWRTFTSDTTWCVRHRTSREPARDGAPARAIDPSTRVVGLRLARLVFSSRALNKSKHSNRVDRSVADDVPPLRLRVVSSRRRRGTRGSSGTSSSSSSSDRTASCGTRTTPTTRTTSSSVKRCTYRRRSSRRWRGSSRRAR
jgi:hypothetical protein